MKKLLTCISVIIVGISPQVYGGDSAERIVSSFKSALKHVNPKKNPDSVKTILRTEYGNRLSAAIGFTQAKKMLEEAEMEIIATNGAIKKLNLKRSVQLEMARLKYVKDMDCANIAKLPMPYKERVAQQRRITEEYKANIRRLIGQQKYDQWMNLLLPSFEDICRTKFNLNDKQIAQLKEVENKRAIAVYAVNKSKSSKEEKKLKINEVKISTARLAKEFLDDSQFKKWCIYRNINYK